MLTACNLRYNKDCIWMLRIFKSMLMLVLMVYCIFRVYREHQGNLDQLDKSDLQ